ncbi:transposase DNA-binding-containing protein [Chloroflexus sp.]|nr:transposase DNA-binding-containing protein [Chloroflexus sp.]
MPHELRDARLGDARVHRRLMRLVEALAAQPTTSVPQACGSRVATNGA